MQLTTLQVKLLNRYRQWRQNPPTVFSLLCLEWKAELMLVGYCLLAGAYCYWAEMQVTLYLVCGAMFGALTRDIGLFRRTTQIWPMLSEVIDWNRVDQVLDQQGSSGGVHQED